MQYYYLVSSLPGIRYDAEKLPIKRLEFDRRVLESVSAEHLGLFNALKYRVDNRNLVEIMSGGGKFAEGGCYSKEEFEYGIKTNSGLPGYMLDFISEESKPGILPEDSLWGFYLKFIGELSSFLSSYFEFERNLRNILTVLNAKNSGLAFDERVVGSDDYVAEAVRHSSASDFGLGREFLFVDRLSELIKNKNYFELERFAGRLRFEAVETFLSGHYFTIESVLGYSLKLEIVERFTSLDAEAGLNRLEDLSGKYAGNKSLYEYV